MLCSSSIDLTDTPVAPPLGELSPKVTERANLRESPQNLREWQLHGGEGGGIMEVSKTPKKKEDTTMKRKKFLALALAGVMTAVTLTACAPLEVLYDWFFGGGGSSNASRGNDMGLVESETLEKSIIRWFGPNNATRE